jgi:alpha-L-arabinofuranosidase
VVDRIKSYKEEILQFSSMKLKYINVLFALFVCMQINAQQKQVLKVDISKNLGAVNPKMIGVFFEDINLGADGGIYAELVKNRSFEFNKPLMGWALERKTPVEGAIMVINGEKERPNNPRYLRINSASVTKGELGVTNEGFRGMGFKKDLKYDFSFLYRQDAEGFTIHMELLDEANKVIGAASTKPATGGNVWQKQTASVISGETVNKGKMRIWFEGDGRIDLDMISLFPTDTWKNRPGGLRADMVQALADLKPGFVRFPGGCIVEGFDLSQRYQWKKTVGPIEERELLINRWNFEFGHRPAPDYYQTFGLGFFEYFQMAEDMGAEALPILNCGMACQFNTAEVVPLDDLQPYIDDALDLIEFANGDVQTKWGALRAQMGHPAPFNMKMLGIGNENWGPQYLERLKLFTKAIKEKYPAIKLVYSSGTDPNGERFDLLNTELRKMNADIIDEHYYRSPQWFFQNASRYDNYPRNGSKVFGGEYAAQSKNIASPENKNNWLTALSEAAFMTGMERNAAVVDMASYAPLFAHVDGWQWTPDLIWVNNHQALKTTDYYVQQLFSIHKGTKVVPVTINNEAIAGKDSLYASATYDENTKELIIKIVNAAPVEQVQNIELNKKGSTASLIVLQSDDLEAMNSFEDPMKVSPKTSALKLNGKKFDFKAAPYSVNVIKVKM